MPETEQALCAQCEQNEADLRWMLDNHDRFGWDRKGERYRRLIAIRERLGYYDEAVPDE